MRTIRVTGKGNIKVKPDMTRITMTLTGCCKEYEETLRHCTEDTEVLKDVLAELDFARDEIKTLSFNVDTKNESYQDKYKSWKSRFIGYEYTHILKVEFGSDNKRLGRVLYALAHASVQPVFRLSYTVKDKEASKNELLGRAVADAKAKAEVLTGAAGVKLLDIQSIDYSWGQIEFEVSPMRRNMLMEDRCMMSEAESSYDMDIEPDDIEVSDTVTVVWEIA